MTRAFTHGAIFLLDHKKANKGHTWTIHLSQLESHEDGLGKFEHKQEGFINPLDVERAGP